MWKDFQDISNSLSALEFSSFQRKWELWIFQTAEWGKSARKWGILSSLSKAGVSQGESTAFNSTGQTLWILILIPQHKPSMDYFKNQSMLKISSCKMPPLSMLRWSCYLEYFGRQEAIIIHNKICLRTDLIKLSLVRRGKCCTMAFPVSCAPPGYSMAEKAKGKLLLPKPFLSRCRG